MSEENIFLFVPNLIGYARVILALISFYFMPTDYVTASVCYITSAVLDMFDGHAARYLNQSTKFGAMLDQLTDRCGTMGLCAVLASFYPAYAFHFLVSMCIDIAGHWIYLHTTVLQGKTSHKFVDMSTNPIMRLYYTNRTVLTVMCAGNETFYAALYLLHFTPGPIIGKKQNYTVFYTGNQYYESFRMRQWIHQTLSDRAAGMSLFQVLVYLSAPIAIVKTAISLLHCFVACKNLSIIDVNERKALREKAK